MQTTITVRHCDIPDALRDRALTVVERLGAFAHRPIESHVVFDNEGARPTAEIRLHTARGEPLVGHGDGDDHRTALDRAEEKLRRQLEKDKALARPRRARGAQPKI